MKNLSKVVSVNRKRLNYECKLMFSYESVGLRGAGLCLTPVKEKRPNALTLCVQAIVGTRNSNLTVVSVFKKRHFLVETSKN